MKPTSASQAIPPAAPPRPREEEQEPLLDAVRGWDRFWFTPADPTTLCMMRICCGLVVLYVHLAYSFGLFNYVGPRAWVDAQTLQYLVKENPTFVPSSTWAGNPTMYDKGQYSWSIFYHVEDHAWIVAIHVFFLVVMLLFTLGLWTPVTSVLTWMGAMSYLERAQTSLFGQDTMMMILLAYLMVGPCGATLSLDSWLARRREQKRRGVAYLPSTPGASVAANFAIRLVQVHFCIIYLAAGFSKLLGSTWWSGTAPNSVLLNYEFAPFNVAIYYKLVVFASQHRWLWEIGASAGILFTLFTEIGFPFLVWNRRTRWVMIICSVMLHTVIGLTMGLVTFGLFMLVMVMSFVPPATVRMLVDRFMAGARGRLSQLAGKNGASGKTGGMALTR
jgi:hypothetical protein